MRCFEKAPDELKNTTFESRIDSVFFNKKILDVFDNNHVKVQNPSLTLTMSANTSVNKDLLHFLDAVQKAA